MNIMKNYNEALQAIYDHVGFEEDYVVCPIDDCTNMYWSIIDNDIVRYAKTKKLFYSYDSYYEDDIYTQRFYKKWVYRGKDYTMVFCNPHVDCMEWFRIFDNKKELKI